MRGVLHLPDDHGGDLYRVAVRAAVPAEQLDHMRAAGHDSGEAPEHQGAGHQDQGA